MSDPRIISLDTETYGKHVDFPEQTCFSPRRSLLVDEVPLPSLVLTCALTIPTFDPRSRSSTETTSPTRTSSSSSSSLSGSSPSPSSVPPSSGSPALWTASLLAQLQPGPTFAFRTNTRDSILKLARWLAHADTIIGMNLAFDISYLRAFHPLLRSLLNGRHTLIDLSVCNYLHCESRPENSLKALGPVLGTHVYDAADLKRLSSWPQLLNYNAQDTHNTLLAVARLATLISSDPRKSDKLSPFCISFYSQTIWSCVWMTEAGVPFNRPSLLSLARRLALNIADKEVSCLPHLTLSGEGSQKSKASFLNTLTTEIDLLSGFTAQQNALTSASDLVGDLQEPPPCTPPTLGPNSTPPDPSPTSSPPVSTETDRSSPSKPIPAGPPHPPAAAGSTEPPQTPSSPTDPSPSASSPPLSSGSSSAGSSWPSDASSSSIASILRHPLLQFTEKRRELSFSDVNRSLLASHLPPSHPFQAVLRDIAAHAHDSKLLGSYCFPLLIHRTNKKNGRWDRSCLLLPQPEHPWQTPPQSSGPSPTIDTKSASPIPTSLPASIKTELPVDASASPATEETVKTTASPSPISLPWENSSNEPSTTTRPGAPNPDVWLSHPTWYVVPSSVKDDSGMGGGTLQGRITCKNDKHQTDPPEIEACRQSRWSGGLLADMDLSQIELRVAALASGDRSLMASYLNGEDLHSRRALSLWSPSHLASKYGDPSYIDQWKDLYPGFKVFERDVSKHVNFADLFRAGAETMQLTVLKMSGHQLPIEFFSRVVERRPTDRPGLWAWQEELIAEATATGRVLLPFTGQSRSFLGGDKYEVNEIVNCPVQTMAGNTLLDIQHYIWRAIKDNPSILMYLNVFDALKFDLRSPSLLPTLSEIVASAVHHCATNGYWAMLCTHFSRTIPLEYTLDHH